MKPLQFTPKYIAYEDEGMPACCGIAVMADLFVENADDNGRYIEEDDFSHTFTQKTKNLWADYWQDYCAQERVDQILATTSPAMKLFEILFKKTGWKKLSVTTNPKTGNKITLWSYQQ